MLQEHKSSGPPPKTKILISDLQIMDKNIIEINKKLDVYENEKKLNIKSIKQQSERIAATLKKKRDQFKEI